MRDFTDIFDSNNSSGRHSCKGTGSKTTHFDKTGVCVHDYYARIKAETNLSKARQIIHDFAEKTSFTQEELIQYSVASEISREI
jgi:hypothetical protein